MKRKTESRPSKQIIHERDLAGRHRIVIVEDGVPSASRWFENYEIGTFKGYHCVAPPVAEGDTARMVLPLGVFRVGAVAHQVLGSSAQQ